LKKKQHKTTIGDLFATELRDDKEEESDEEENEEKNASQ
jgi:hypothetical protein